MDSVKLEPGPFTENICIESAQKQILSMSNSIKLFFFFYFYCSIQYFTNSTTISNTITHLLAANKLHLLNFCKTFCVISFIQKLYALYQYLETMNLFLTLHAKKIVIYVVAHSLLI